MRPPINLFLMVALLSGCGLRERFATVEDRINAALPPNASVQVARQLLLAQVAPQPEAQKALEPMWANRLRLRALSCSKEFTPSWRDSEADIRSRLTNTACFTEADSALQRWLGLQRTRLLLAQGPLRAAPESLPPMVTHSEFIYTLAQARDASIVLLRGSNGYDIVDLGRGKSLFKEALSQSAQGLMELSPNGRLFSLATAGKVAIRATEGGETLVELPQTDGVLWLDADVMALRRNGTANLRLLDLASGEESAVPGQYTSHTFVAVRAAGVPHRFNLFVDRGVNQIEIVKTDGRHEALLRAEKRLASGVGFANNTGGISADGKMWVDGNQSLRVLNLETLELDEPSFKPVSTQSAWPTAKPQEFLIGLHLPHSDGAGSPLHHYLYDASAGTLAKVKREAGSSIRYQYLDAIKRLALIEGQNLRFIDTPAADPALPVATVVATFLDEMNQRRLAAASAQQAAMTGLPVVPLNPAQMTPLQLQLRDAQVEGVGVYQGAGSRHGVGQPRTAGTVHVRVRRASRPLALVLTSYEPVRWKLVLEPGAKLAAVLLGGYHDSDVEGAGNARVYQIGRGYAYGQQSAEFAELQRTAVRWVGKPMAVFQGRYEGGSFSTGGE